MRQVACRSLFNWGAENISARGKHCPLALGTKSDGFDIARSGNPTGATRQAIVRNIDRYGRALAALQVQDLQLAFHLVNDAALVIGAGPANVPGSVMGYL